MNLIAKFKETITSVLPVMLIVIVLGSTIAPLGLTLLARFIFGGIFLIIGLTFFLMGVDIGIQPIGERTGASLTSKRNLQLLLAVSFAIGFLVTVAEPDIQVFSDQIHSFFPSVIKSQLVIGISSGVGIFIMVGLLRILLRVPIKLLLFILYTISFIICYFCPNAIRGIAFDSGGATTGPMTVPFILALGVGVSSVRSTGNNDGDSFGLTGITSIGPIIAVLIYGIILQKSGNLDSSLLQVSKLEDQSFWVFFHMFPHVLKEASLSILPLIIMLVVFQLTLLHLPPHQLMRIIFGLVWSFLGLTVFLLGVNGGFMECGLKLGQLLGEKAISQGGLYSFLLVFIGMILGAVVVCAEPAVWVLTEQVEALSGGTIKRKLLLVFLSFGASIAIGLTMWKALCGISLIKILFPGYIIALLLMIWSPKLFTSIAFDSGGVASGPITSTFILSFTLGAGNACKVGNDSFGVIALVSMTPLIAIQILGIIYNRKKMTAHKDISITEDKK